MKNIILMACLLFTVGSARANHDIYVRVSGSSTVDESYYKNHLTIRNLDDDGYLLVNAAFRNTGVGDHWLIEASEVDNNGAIQWSFEYELLEANNDELSVVPFCVIPNLSNDGYVISAGWEDAGSSSFRHDGTVSPFYLEIDDVGNVLNSQRHTVEGGSSGFAPLSICAGVNEYIVVGVRSTNYACIECGGGKAGRIAKLSYNLTEKVAVDLNSTFTITPPTPTIDGDSSIFNALSTVKKIPGLNAFIITGSLTSNFVDPSETSATYYGNAGISTGYIARIASDLTVDWEKTFTDYSGAGAYDTDPINSTCSDVFIDPSVGGDTMFAVINVIGVSPDNRGNWATGILVEMSYSTSNIFRMKNFDAVVGGSPFTFSGAFWTNVFATNDSVYLCGFARRANTSPATQEYRRLWPVNFTLSRIGFSSGYSFSVHGDNFEYDAPPEYEDCYLGMNYRLTNLSHKDLICAASGGVLTTSTQPVSSSKHQQAGPVIYYPSSWEYDDEERLVCYVPYHAQNSSITYPGTPSFSFIASKQFYPSLYHSITSIECNFNDEDFMVSDETLVMASTNVTPVDSSGEIENTIVDASLDIVTGNEDCGPKMFPDDEFDTPFINGLDNLGSNGFENPTNDGSRFVVYDMTGKVIGNFATKSQIVDNLTSIGVASGIYIIAEFSDTRLVNKQKIIIQ